MNLIPYLGPILGAVPAVPDRVGQRLLLAPDAVPAAGVPGGADLRRGHLIPVLVAKIVDLHPVTVIVVIIAGAQVMGIVGMVISIPVAATLKVTMTPCTATSLTPARDAR